jgi:manganese/iron transport system permease protein
VDLSVLGYKFMQNAVLAGLFAGVSCSVAGVFVVAMHLSFIGVALSHAALAGALLAVWLGCDPLVGAFGASLLATAVIGPLADRGQFNPDTAIGIIFASTMGLAFLFLGLIPGPKTQALELLWGSILSVSNHDLVLLGLLAVAVPSLILLFFKEIQAVICNREIALAVGIPASLVFYAVLFIAGATITASLQSIGGLLIFNLIINPAAAAYQITYSLRTMFILAALFGVLSSWCGLFVSYLLDIPTGATIALISVIIFAAAAVFSPKRRVKRWRPDHGIAAER